jgi:nitroreductase
MDSDTNITLLLTRRSVSPKRLMHPAPSREALNSIIGAALRAPDHAGLLPWRVVEFPSDTRASLGRLFEAEKLRRDPVACEADLARAREHATQPPTVLAFVVRVQRHRLVPLQEQWLTAGAALGNILSAAHALGFGAMILSGERCHDELLRSAIGVEADEFLAGFISIGTISRAPPPAPKPPRERVWSSWQPALLRATQPYYGRTEWSTVDACQP